MLNFFPQKGNREMADDTGTITSDRDYHTGELTRVSMWGFSCKTSREQLKTTQESSAEY